MGNSIEEDIKNAEHFIKSIKTDKEYKEDGWHGYYNKEIIELTRIIEHILSDYKRALKENEELNEKILDNAGIYQLGFKDGEESYIKKVKDKIRKNEEIIDISNDGDLIHELYQKNKVYEELLESEE